MTERFHDSMTLAEARAILRELVDEGHDCPLCTQHAKVYKFPVNAAIARALILMYRKNGKDWVDVPELGLPGGHFAKLRYWGLIEKPDGRREDGSTRVGIWRVTDAGEDWLMGHATIQKKAHIYNNRCLKLSGDPVTITDALGKAFDYRELMYGGDN
jgi:hypothetical protein